MIRLSLRTPTLCLALLAGGCDSPLSPSEAAGTYVLQSVGGSPLPVVVIDNAYATVTLLADTLRLKPDRTGTEVHAARVLTHGSGRPEATSAGQMPLVYRLREGQIDIRYICPPEALCTMGAVPPHATGRFTADGLVLRAVPKEFVFRRID
jgi:hypothetical protein